MPETPTTTRRRRKATAPAAAPAAVETPEETPAAVETPETLPAVPETPETPAETETPEETPLISAKLAEAATERGDTLKDSTTVDPDALAAEMLPLVRSLSSLHSAGESYIAAVCRAIALVRSLIFLKGETQPDWAGTSWAARMFTREAVLNVAHRALTDSGMETSDADAAVETLNGRIRQAMKRKYLAPVIAEYVASLPVIVTAEDGSQSVALPDLSPEEITARVKDQYHGAGLLAPGEKRTRNPESVTPAAAITAEKADAAVETLNAASVNLPQSVVGTAILRTLGQWFQVLRKDESFRGADGQDRAQTIALVAAIADLAADETDRLNAELSGDALVAHYTAVESAAVAGIAGKDPAAK